MSEPEGIRPGDAPPPAADPSGPRPRKRSPEERARLRARDAAFNRRLRASIDVLIDNALAPLVARVEELERRAGIAHEDADTPTSDAPSERG